MCLTLYKDPLHKNHSLVFSTLKRFSFPNHDKHTGLNHQTGSSNDSADKSLSVCVIGSGPAVPVLSGSGGHRDVSSQQQQSVSELPPQPSARVSVPRPDGVPVHR